MSFASEFLSFAILAVFLILPQPAASGPSASHDLSHDPADPHMQAMERTRQALKAKLGASYDLPLPPATPAQLVQGKKLYEQYCQTCHGVSGKGDGPAGAALKPPPGDFTDALHSAFYSDRGRMEIIKSGSPGTAMTAWATVLKNGDLEAVYQYVRQFRQTPPAKPQQAHDHSAHAKPKAAHDHDHDHDHKH